MKNEQILEPKQKDASPYTIRLRLLELALDIVRENVPDGASAVLSADHVIAEAEKLNVFVSGRGGDRIDPDKERAAGHAARDAGVRA